MVNIGKLQVSPSSHAFEMQQGDSAAMPLSLKINYAYIIYLYSIQTINGYLLCIIRSI